MNHTKDQYNHAGHFSMQAYLQSQDIITRDVAIQNRAFCKKKKKEKKKKYKKYHDAIYKKNNLQEWIATL